MWQERAAPTSPRVRPRAGRAMANDMLDAWPRDVFTLPWRGRVARESARGGVKAAGTELAGPLSPPPDRLRRSTSPLQGPPGGGKARLPHGLFVQSPTARADESDDPIRTVRPLPECSGA